MKLFETRQIAEIDKYTIENEPISDVGLMERASLQMTNWLVQHFSTDEKLMFFAGPGNNGGDALAMARQIADLGFICEVYLLDFGKELKGAPKINWERLEKQGKVKLVKIRTLNDFPEITETDVILDGVFGSGLSRPLDNLAAELVKKLNQHENPIVSIDIPSGLMGEDNSANNLENIIRADYTLTLQFPKISFLFSENEPYVGEWIVLPIGLHPVGIKNTISPYVLLEQDDICEKLPVRSKFDHKGTYGHALLIAGSYGKMGAAVLSSKACLRAGTGLLTVHVPHIGYQIIQTAVPEVMANVDRHDSIFTEFPDLLSYDAIGIGPGLDKKINTQKAFSDLLEAVKVPMVIDADGLNILSQHPEWLNKLPAETILTPHPGEFKRLVGVTQNSFDALQAQINFSKKYNCVVVLKGAHTSITDPNGSVYFNSTGNPGMATAGSGDVLTGIILGLLAQGVSSVDAAICGVYLHGLAGDVAIKEKAEAALIAGDIIENLGKAYQILQ
jgi:NAD(P)H-hydrate epimerase